MIDGFGRGNLVFPEAADALVASIEELIPRAKAIGRPIMNLHGAKLSSAGPAAEPVYGITEANLIIARSTLCRVAELGERHDMYFTIENLNPLDHPGVPINRARDILSLIKSVDSPRVKINLDLYHAQKDGGNLISLLKDCRDYVAEVQIADVPDRDVAGGGEIHYVNVARAMHELGYACSVGLEAWAHGDSRVALERYKSIFAKFHAPLSDGRK
jgi:hydroxypyruvate isomerase